MVGLEVHGNRRPLPIVAIANELLASLGTPPDHPDRPDRPDHPRRRLRDRGVVSGSGRRMRTHEKRVPRLALRSCRSPNPGGDMAEGQESTDTAAAAAAELAYRPTVADIAAALRARAKNSSGGRFLRRGLIYILVVMAVGILLSTGGADRPRPRRRLHLSGLLSGPSAAPDVEHRPSRAQRPRPWLEPTEACSRHRRHPQPHTHAHLIRGPWSRRPRAQTHHRAARAAVSPATASHRHAGCRPDILVGSPS